MSGFCEQPFQRSSAWGRDNLAILGHFSFKWNPSLTKIIKENIFQLWSIGDILPGAVANAPSDGNSWALVIQTICVDFVLKKKFYYWTEHGTWKYMFYEALVKQSWLEILVRRLNFSEKVAQGNCDLSGWKYDGTWTCCSLQPSQARAEPSISIGSWLGCFLHQESWVWDRAKCLPFQDAKVHAWKAILIEKNLLAHPVLLSAKSTFVPLRAFLNVLSNFIWNWTMGCCFQPRPCQ